MALSASTALKTCLFHVEIAAWLVAVGLLIASEPRWAAASALLALGADVGGRLWSRRSPVPMPHFMRWILLVASRPALPFPHTAAAAASQWRTDSRDRPWSGNSCAPIAAALKPDGVLDVLDVQQEMLDDLMRRAARSDLSNIVPRQGDAQRLPYADASFDAAYLISVLGEIPDATSALRELRRVLKPGARLLVCEVLWTQTSSRCRSCTHWRGLRASCSSGNSAALCVHCVATPSGWDRLTRRRSGRAD